MSIYNFSSILKNFFFFFNFLLVRQFYFNNLSLYSFVFSRKSQVIFHKFFMNLYGLLVFDFKLFIDVFGVDYLNYNTDLLFFPVVRDYKLSRFSLVYMFRSLKFNYLFLLNLYLVKYLFFYSINYIFKGSCWSERECFDMFGFFFYANFDLRRILTDYGFKGYPLLKDFPLLGFSEVSYNYELEAVVYDFTSLNQNYRNFFIFNNWGVLETDIQGFFCDKFTNFIYC